MFIDWHKDLRTLSKNIEITRVNQSQIKSDTYQLEQYNFFPFMYLDTFSTKTQAENITKNSLKIAFLDNK
jgi:hypothetical protein